MKNRRLPLLLVLSLQWLAEASLLAQVHSLSSIHFDRDSVPVGQGPGSVVVADVNHDGAGDILVVNAANETLSVLLNDGRGRFHVAPGTPAKTGKAPNDLAVGDFNLDGDLDLAIPNTETPNMTILLGDGKGGFRPSPQSPFVTASHPHVHGVATADFNGDGKFDVVTDSWGENKILMLLGDGAGNLIVPGRAFNTGKRPYQRLRSADFNKDGHPDVVTTDLDQNAVSILLGDGRGGLQDAPGSPFPAGAAPWAVAVGDIDGDGNLDLAVIPYDRDVTDPAEVGVTVLLGNGKGGFTKMSGSPFSLAGCRGPDRVAIGDVNGDGLRDIVVTCAQNNRAMIYLGEKTREFQRISVDVPTGWSGLAVADLDGDAKDEIIVSDSAGGKIAILHAR